MSFTLGITKSIIGFKELSLLFTTLSAKEDFTFVLYLDRFELIVLCGILRLIPAVIIVGVISLSFISIDLSVSSLSCVSSAFEFNAFVNLPGFQQKIKKSGSK